MLSSAVTKDTEIAWKTGRLKYKLHADQRVVYDKYKAWRTNVIEQRKRGAQLPGKYPLIWITDCSRRWGKDFLGLTVAIEDAIKMPEAVLTYGTSFLKDLGDVVIPLAKQLTGDCPVHLRPQYKDNYRGTSQGLYFPNGSVIRFVGIDKNPDGLRGRHSDGVFITEGAFCDMLEDVVTNVLQPQLIGRYHATVMMNSTPPKATHEWDREFVPDAKERGAYVMRTIDDCPIYTQAEKDLFTGGEKGRQTSQIQREYYCIRAREETLVVLPEFKKDVHVREFELPAYAHAYTVIDPAVQDLCAINFCVWDFLNNRLLIVDEFTKRNANTHELVDAIREKELKLWNSAAHPLQFWNGRELKPNPATRISDNDAGGLRMIQDFQQLHGLKVTTTLKDEAEAALHALRNAFLYEKIWIHPRCVNTIEHCEGAIWNKARNSYARSERLGHADHVDCLKYIWRHIPKAANPYPPASYVTLQRSENRDNLFLDPERLKTRKSLMKTLDAVFGGRRKR